MGYDLDRFVDAQRPVYEAALEELRRGRKTSHWMWFVFPQVAGLGHSEASQRFAIGSLGEARAYLAHPVLGPRLRECAEAVLAVPDRTAEEILGSTDAKKLRSSMTMFHRVSPDEPLFTGVLNRFYNGETDPATDTRLRAGLPAAGVSITDGDWTVDLAPDGEVTTCTVAPGLELRVVTLVFDPWDGPPLHMREDCNKRGGRVIGDEGELSCAEVEIVKRLRRAGWEAAWVQAFKCGRDTWSAYIRDVPNFPDVVRRIQAVAGTGGGHPDVLAWKGDRVVAIESKGSGDRLKPSQIDWFQRARHAGVAAEDLGVVEWRARG